MSLTDTDRTEALAMLFAATHILCLEGGITPDELRESLDHAINEWTADNTALPRES